MPDITGEFEAKEEEYIQPNIDNIRSESSNESKY